MTYLLLFASTAAAELFVLRRLRFGWFIVAVVLAGTLVDVSYLGYTAMTERNYDTPSHVLYIDYLAEHLRLPPVTVFCTACGHPPLYYALAALWSKTVLALGLVPRELGLQWLSLLLHSAFVVFALLLLRSMCERPATMQLAAALVVFWPSSIINSVRVHNDALAAPLMLAAIYFTAAWDRQGRPRDYYLAVAAAALALLTKATGLAVAATLLLAAAWRLRSTTRDRRSVRQCTGAALVLLGTAVLGTAFRQSMPPHTLCQKVLGRACDVPRESFVGNRPSNYLGFDLVDFVSGTDSLAYPPREDHFLNGLAKSSLYGVMPLGRDFSGARYELLAVVMNLVLLAMAAVCLAVSPSLRPVRWPLYRVPILAGASLLVLLLGFRIMVPTPFHEDFRHIFPVLVPLCLWYAKAVERLRDWSDWLSRAGLGLGLLMIGASVAFFLRPWGS